MIGVKNLSFFLFLVYNNSKGETQMAKIAKVGYGSRGQGTGKTNGEGYTYLVGDSVRTGDRIQVISTSRNGKKFPTTGVPLHTYGENTVKGKEAKGEAEKATGQQPTQAYTGKELGLDMPFLEKMTLSQTETPQLKGQKQQSEYTQMTRAKAIGKYLGQNPTAELTQNARETFDSYSKKFMKGES